MPPIERCVTCNDVLTWEEDAHEFVRPDGSSVVVCGECCRTIAANIAADV